MPVLSGGSEVAVGVFGSAGDAAVVVVVAEVQVVGCDDWLVAAPAGDGFAASDGCCYACPGALVLVSVAACGAAASVTVVLLAVLGAQSAVGIGGDEGGASRDSADLHASPVGWTTRDLNPAPSACKADALPDELVAREVKDPRRALR